MAGFHGTTYHPHLVEYGGFSGMSPRGPDSSSRGGSPAFSFGSPKLYSHLEWDDEFRVPGTVYSAALFFAASYLVAGMAYITYINQ